jgi:cytochrome b561
MIEDNQRRNGYNTLQSVRHITMAVLFIAMGVLMIFAEKFKIEQLLNFDKFFRYFFGGICFLYGGFRFYRGIKKDY